MFPGWWTRRDKIAFAVCIAVGISITDAVGESVRPPLDFWAAFAVKVAAGWVAGIATWVIWWRFIRRDSDTPKTQG
jgi:hypothetical protein